MKKLTQPERVFELLKDHPNKKFTSAEIAKYIVEKYAEDYLEKRNNPRFKSDNDFLSQIRAEIGAHKNSILKKSEKIRWQDNPKPRRFWYEEVSEPEELSNKSDIEPEDLSDDYSESDLYPLLMEYLKSEHGLYCMRIDEKRSSNKKGIGANKWLHPDVVGMEAVAEAWHSHVKTCINQGGGDGVRLWSFEVKIKLTIGNVRQYFFQSVSNSSWANEGYLVATEIANSAVEDELRTLCTLHGIGVILLSYKNPSESTLLIPAKKRKEIDWGSVNRIVKENRDFKDFIDLVANYYETGRIREKDWDNF